MAGALLGVCGVFIILMSDEVLWRLKVVRGEYSRKLAHVLVGTFIAFWPFFMSMRAIQILSLVMLVVITISHRYRIFQSIHAVKRRTYGEYFFPTSIGLTALITDSEWVFMAAILHLSLADGLAALIGNRIGHSNRYKILGQTKSWAGTITFYVVSLLIVGWVMLSNMEQFTYANVWLIAVLPLLATAAESVAIYGTDDLFVPLLVVWLLETMRRVIELPPL